MNKKSIFVNKVAIVLCVMVCVIGVGAARPARGASLSSSLPSSLTFSRSLVLGDNHPDVRSLQIILNSDPATQIASFGPGSPGEETSYFGVKTRVAVIKFQEKYKNEVLSPAGLSRGTGFVGDLTRAKLLKVAGGPQNSQVPISSTTSALPLTITPSQNDEYQDDSPSEDDMRLYQALPQQVKPGELITLKGDNLQKGTLHIGKGYTTPLMQIGIDSYTVKIPATLALGTYEVWVTSTSGETSRRRIAPISIDITENPAPVPTISSLSPSSVHSLSDSITVSGSALNGSITVASAGGTLVVTGNGTSLTFSPRDFSNKQVFESALGKLPPGSGISIHIVVVTNGGMASSTFILQ